ETSRTLNDQGFAVRHECHVMDVFLAETDSSQAPERASGERVTILIGTRLVARFGGFLGPYGGCNEEKNHHRVASKHGSLPAKWTYRSSLIDTTFVDTQRG